MYERQMSAHQVSSFLTIGTLYSYLYCMLSSSVMLSLPILGGALYLIGQTTILFVGLRQPSRSGLLTKSMQRVSTVLLIIQFLLLLSLITVYPIHLANADFWRLSGIVLCITLRPMVAHYAVERSLLTKRSTMRILGRICLTQILFLPPLLVMLLFSPMGRDAVWALVGGYLVSGILESFPLERMRSRLISFSEEDRKETDALRTVHAYRMFQYLMLVIAAALQVTQVMTYTYIAFSADALILCMGIALLCTYAASFAANTLMRRASAKNTDPNLLITVGLVIWLYGLVLFSRSLDTPESVNGYLSLALCTMGATASVRVLVGMEGDMRRVAAFAIGHTPGGALDLAQQIRIDLSSLAGQIIALIGLTLLSIFTETAFPNNWDAAFRSFSPLLTLPALLLVGAAIGFALRFPLTKRHLEKLKKYTEMQQEGQENASLHDQLEAVVVHKSLKRYGIKVLLFVCRPFYYHKILGKENIHLDDDTPCIFVCNHGEIYGPVASTLYVPFSFRPWVTYEMADRSAIAERTMNGTFRNTKGLTRKFLNWVMNHIGAPFMAWIMKSVDCIPVYHDNPRMLRKTFRETTAAMEAGDNILLFPENADTSSDHHYVLEGVSEFFTGFTMIGQMYNLRTGKCPLFVPLYANKHNRTITFGVPTRYNPDTPTNEEKERLCTYLRNEMLRVGGFPTEDSSPAE